MQALHAAWPHNGEENFNRESPRRTGGETREQEPTPGMGGGERRTVPLPRDAGIRGNKRAVGGFAGNSKFEISDFKSPISDH